MQYTDCEHILFSRAQNGVLTMTLNRPQRLNAVNERMHLELSEVWDTIESDPDVAVVLVRGAGGNFSSGGDLEMVSRMAEDPSLTVTQLHETSRLVFGMINCSKPIVSAIDGIALGAGLVVALLADISIAATDARLNDGHLRLGVAAGDHAALVWPLLCGMARAKRYLLTGAFIDGAEAERIGLVSMAVESSELHQRAALFADELAQRDSLSLAWTKRSLNHWLRAAGPAFEHSLALEMLSFTQAGVRQGLDAIASGAAAERD